MNITRVDKHDDYDVFVGRPSKWGNPFKVGRDGSKSEVIAKFEEYFKNHPDLNKLLEELDGKRIACWCPLETACHSDVIIRIAKLKRFDDILG